MQFSAYKSCICSVRFVPRYIAYVCVCCYWKWFYHFKSQLFMLVPKLLKSTDDFCILIMYKDELAKLTLVLVAFFVDSFEFSIYNHAAWQLKQLCFFSFVFFPSLSHWLGLPGQSCSRFWGVGEILHLLPLSMMVTVGFLLGIIFFRLSKFCLIPFA